MKMTAEKAYRPTTFDNYIGQPKVKKILKIAIKAAQMKNEPLDNILISGPSSCGKTTLAQIIANESGQSFKAFSCPSLKRVEDVIDILMNVEENSILFLEECHRLPKKLQEIIFLAMEQFYVDVMEDGEPIRYNLPRFTTICATNEVGGLAEPMRNRFMIQINLTPYTDDDMLEIVNNNFNSMGVEIDNECAELIAGCTRGVPRNANSYCRRVYDVALVTNDGIINEEVVYDTFDLMDINEYGLNSTDMRYLQLLYDNRKSTGLDTIALALGTDKKSIETVVEPYLFKGDFASKGPRGRKITQKGVEVVELCSDAQNF